jgi:hypothetical protein
MTIARYAIEELIRIGAAIVSIDVDLDWIAAPNQRRQQGRNARPCWRRYGLRCTCAKPDCSSRYSRWLRPRREPGKHRWFPE